MTYRMDDQALAEIQQLADRVRIDQTARTVTWRPPRGQRLRTAVDLLAWPVLSTAVALLPRRVGRWLREAPDEPDVVA